MYFVKSNLFLLFFITCFNLFSQDYNKLASYYYDTYTDKEVTFLKDKVEKANAQKLIIELLEKFNQVEKLKTSANTQEKKIRQSFNKNYPKPKNSSSCIKFNSYKKRFEAEDSRSKKIKILVNTAKINVNLCRNNIYNKTGCTQQVNYYNSQIRLYNQAISNTTSFHNKAKSHLNSCNRYEKLFISELKNNTTKLKKARREYLNKYNKLKSEIEVLNVKIQNKWNN